MLSITLCRTDPNTTVHYAGLCNELVVGDDVEVCVHCTKTCNASLATSSTYELTAVYQNS